VEDKVRCHKLEGIVSRRVKIPTLVAKNATRVGHPRVFFRSNQYLAGKLSEWVDDLQAIEVAGVLHVFGKEDGAAGLFGGADDERVPEGKVVKAVQVDGGENVRDFGSGDVELSQKFNFAAGDARFNAQLLCDRDEIFLQHLQRHDSRPRPPVLGHEIEGASLLGGHAFIVGVNKDVGVEEATSGHRLYLVELCRE